MNDLERIKAFIAPKLIEGDFEIWLDRKLPESNDHFPNQTPREIIAQGKGSELLAILKKTFDWSVTG